MAVGQDPIQFICHSSLQSFECLGGKQLKRVNQFQKQIMTKKNQLNTKVKDQPKPKKQISKEPRQAKDKGIMLRQQNEKKFEKQINDAIKDQVDEQMNQQNQQSQSDGSSSDTVPQSKESTHITNRAPTLKENRTQKRNIKAELLAVKKQNILMTKVDVVLQKDTQMPKDEKKEILACLKRGWENYKEDERQKVREVFFGEKVEKQFIDWVNSPSVERGILDLMSPMDLFVIVAGLITRESKWAMENQVIITDQLLQMLDHCDSAEELIPSVTQEVLELLIQNSEFFLEKYEKPCPKLLAILIEKQVLPLLLPALKLRFPIKPDEVHDFGPDIQLKKGFKQSQATYIYFSSLKHKYKNVEPRVLKLALNEPDTLLYDGVLGVFNTLHVPIQLLMCDLYEKAVTADCDHEQACSGIALALKLKSGLAASIIKNSKGERINPDKLSDILQIMAVMDPTEWDKCMSIGLKDTAKNISSFVASGGGKEYQTNEIKEFYQKLMEDPGVKTYAQGFEEVFNNLEQIKNSKYKLNSYQVGIATQMFSQAQLHKHVCALVAPGDGKTFIIIALANFHVQLKYEVVIVVIDPMLHQQLTKDVQVYCDTTKVSVCLAEFLTQERVSGKVVLLDEVDHMIDHQTVQFESVSNVLTTKGLICATYAAFTFMLSATLDAFHYEFLQHIFGMDKTKILTYKSQFELHNMDDYGDSKITKELHKSEDSIRSSILKVLKERGRGKPVVIFFEEKETELDQFIRQTCKQYNLLFKTVDSAEQANSVRAGLVEMGHAVIRVARKYARGYDLKLMKDSIVVVVANGNEIRYHEVQQMLGRGCRSQGKSQSIIMMLDQNGINSEQQWKELKIRTSPIVGESSLNLKPVMKVLNYVHGNHKEIISAYNNNQWQVSVDSFNNSQDSLLRKFTKWEEAKNTRDEKESSKRSQQEN